MIIKQENRLGCFYATVQTSFIPSFIKLQLWYPLWARLISSHLAHKQLDCFAKSHVAEIKNNACKQTTLISFVLHEMKLVLFSF